MSDQQAQELTPEQAARQAWTRTAAGQKGMRMSMDFLKGFLAARPVQVERPDERTHYLLPDAEDAGHETATACGALPLAEPSSRPTAVDCLDCLRTLVLAAARLPERPDEGITDAMIQAAAKESKVAYGPRLDGLTPTLILNAARQILEAGLAARPVSSEETPDGR